MPERVVAPIEREVRDVQADGTRGGPLADHDVEREVLHRRVEDLLDLTVEPVDLVDEQHVARLQVRQDRGEVPRPRDGGTGGRLDLGPHLVGDHRCERGLSQTGGPEKITWSRLSPRL